MVEEITIGEIIKSVSSGVTKTHNNVGQYVVYGSTGIIGYSDIYDYCGEKVLIARVGANAGAVNIVDGQYGVSDNALILEIMPQYNKRYVYYQLNRLRLYSLLLGSGQPLLTGTQLKKLKFWNTELKEQSAITEALSDIDNLMTSLQKLIDKKKAIKQGAMQGLLTGKKRLPGYGGKWLHKALGEVATVKDGTHGTFERKRDGILLLSAKNVFNGHLVLDNESFISREDYLKIVENGFPAKGDILLSCVGTIGRCCIYTDKPKAAFQRSVAFIRTGKMCNTFLLYLLQEEDIQNRLRQSANASAQGGVYLGTLTEIGLYYPGDLEEQQAIAQIFTDMDNEIEQLEKKLAKYQQIRQGMMQELLTGHIRLIDDVEET